MPQFDPTYYTSQIFWLVVCFFLLIFFMRFVGVPRIQNGLQTRNLHLESFADKEAAYHKEIQDLREKLETLKKEEERHTKHMLDQVHQRVVTEKEKQLSALHQKLLSKQKELDESLEEEMQEIYRTLPDFKKKMSAQILTLLSSPPKNEDSHAHH